MLLFPFWIDNAAVTSAHIPKPVSPPCPFHEIFICIVNGATSNPTLSWELGEIGDRDDLKGIDFGEEDVTIEISE
jgi:hypothetical protein